MATAQRKPTPPTRTPPKAAPGARPAPPAARPQSKAVAPRQTTAVARQEDLPEYIKTGVGKGRGNENVGMGDVVIPRVEIVQALSPCKKANEAGYIEGSEDGAMFNTVTRELYGSEIHVIPIFFKVEYLIWKDRQKGGGFRGAYPTIADANARIEGEDDASDLQALETAQQLVLVINPETGEANEAVLSMARTKMKISKQWNSLIRINGHDRFSRVYKIFTSEETNSKNQTYWNFGIMNAGFPQEDAYRKAEALYTAISSGARQMVVDTSDGPETESPTGEY